MLLKSGKGTERFGKLGTAPKDQKEEGNRDKRAKRGVSHSV